MWKRWYKKFRLLRVLIQCTIALIRLFANFLILFKSKVSFNNAPLKIAFVAPIHSAHFANFMEKLHSQYRDENIEVCLINSDPNNLIRSFNFKDILIDGSIYSLFGYNKSAIDWQHDIFVRGENEIGKLSKKYVHYMLYMYKPELIWVHDLQTGGYMVEDKIGSLKKRFKKATICASVWGNDLYYFKDSPVHVNKLQKILKDVDFLHIESERERKVALKLGYLGEFFPVSNITMTDSKKFMCDTVVEEKDIFIVVKGSYFFRSNILSFIHNLECDFSFWGGRKIVFVNVTDEDVFHILRVKHKHNLDIEYKRVLAHKEFISTLSKAKFFLSLNLSDGIPNSVAEAVHVNCIPVMSNHTGLSNALNNFVTDLIVYEFSGVIFSKIFACLISLSNKDVEILLSDLKGVFQNQLYNENVQKNIFDKVLSHVKETR